ncbi:osmotically inducible protein C [Thermococcus profundus]|uniref:Osmotically inducible protein C n=1 Tax=Thermococcus profundus TaxID=49899 RepID=A0A2Z2MDH0_THEPR|nr:OsmC family protein [Thermococcus profundus]ASJ03613.1 osmotically inducible protein C [Thermococcus profundus]
MPKYKDMPIRLSGVRLSPTKMKVVGEDFEITVDKLGGDAPSPLHYQLAALAGCLNIVATLVAKDMKISIEDLSVEIEGIFNPARFMGADEGRAGFKEVKAIIKVKTEADPGTLKRWLEEVEERCPISDNLANTTPVKVNFELV